MSSPAADASLAIAQLIAALGIPRTPVEVGLAATTPFVGRGRLTRGRRNREGMLALGDAARRPAQGRQDGTSLSPPPRVLRLLWPWTILSGIPTLPRKLIRVV